MTSIIMFRTSILCVFTISSIVEVTSTCSCLRRMTRLENKINLRLDLEKAERIDVSESLREERVNIVEVIREEMRQADEEGQKKRRDADELLRTELGTIRVDMKKADVVRQKERLEGEMLLKKDLETLTDKVELIGEVQGKGDGMVNNGSRDGVVDSGIIDDAVEVQDMGSSVLNGGTTEKPWGHLLNNLRVGLIVEKRKSQQLGKVVNWLKKRLLNSKFLHFNTESTGVIKSLVSKNKNNSKATNNFTKAEHGNDTEAMLTTSMGNSSYDESAASSTDVTNNDIITADSSRVSQEIANITIHINKLTRNVEHIQNEMKANGINLNVTTDTMRNDIEQFHINITKSYAKIAGIEQMINHNAKGIETCTTNYKSVVTYTAQTMTKLQNRITKCESDVSSVKNLTHDVKHIAGMKKEIMALKSKVTHIEQTLAQHIQSVQQWKAVNVAKWERSLNSLDSLVETLNRGASEDVVAFSVILSSSTFNTTSATRVPMDVVKYNYGGYFHRGDASFHAPFPGVYSFFFNTHNMVAGTSMVLFIYTEKPGQDKTVVATGIDHRPSGYGTVGISALVQMEKGETASAWIFGDMLVGSVFWGRLDKKLVV